MKRKNERKLTGTYFYDAISEDEYKLYRHIGFNVHGEPVYEDIENANETLIGIPESSIELVPIMTLSIEKIMDEYYFIFRHDDGTVVRAYNMWSIQKPVDIKEELKAMEEIENCAFSLYINDNVDSIMYLGIRNKNIAYNIISLFHIETGIYETKHSNLITDKYEAEHFIDDLEKELDVEITGYKIFRYDFSINLSKIAQDYMIVCNDDKFYLLTYMSKPRELDPENNEDDKVLQEVKDFMNDLIKR